jgi:hypothetical protein
LKIVAYFQFYCYNSRNMSEHHHNDDNYDEKIEKMVSLTVSAARGEIPIAHISMPLAQIASGTLAPPEARQLARTLLLMLNGERDPIALVEDLTPELSEVVWEALAEIDAAPVEVDDEREEITFEQLVEKVGAACLGDVMLWQRLWDFTEELVTDEQYAPEIQTLGTVLRKILAGERQQHVLAPLAAEHHQVVEQLLAWLNQQAVEPYQQPEK